MSKKINPVEKIELIAKKIGLEDNKEKTILNLEKSDEPDKKILTLKSGSWDGEEPWFLIDEDEKVHTMLSLDTLLQIIKALRKAQEENFHLKLEKTIWQSVPIDFQDVWVVAMDEIKKRLKNAKDKRSLDINVSEVVKEIKKKHPNLFLNLDKYLPQFNNKEEF